MLTLAVIGLIGTFICGILGSINIMVSGFDSGFKRHIVIVIAAVVCQALTCVAGGAYLIDYIK